MRERGGERGGDEGRERRGRERGGDEGREKWGEGI